jgi:transposase-like protein
MSAFNQPHFHNEEAAYAFVEKRVWPTGPVCPHCGGFERIGKLEGKSTRIGVYKCYQCRKPFSVKVGTVFEASHIKLHLWLQAMFLMASSKKGISSNQLHRTLGVTLKSAWFMSHRLREAMTTVGFEPMGGHGKTVEVDETYFGDKELVIKRTIRGKSGLSGKRAVVSLVERNGKARSFYAPQINKLAVRDILFNNLHRGTSLNTDESRLYSHIAHIVKSHAAVHHAAGEYVRGNVHTNTVEGFFSIFKRGMKGIYQHCSEKHLQRYLNEFDFRYSHRVALGVDDEARTDQMVKGIVGKRLTYRTIN